MSAALAAAPAPRIREFAFGPKDHEAIAALVYEESGILLPAAKAQLVYGRLARRVRARGLTDFSAYLALIDEDPAERLQAVDALTTNHTSFFREAHHFDHFRDHVWPDLSRRLDSGGRVRLWSAACSSGEEPYTWLLTMLGTDRAAPRRLVSRDLRLLATDLSPSVIEAARAGRYAMDVVKPVPAEMKSAWFQRDGDGMTVIPDVRVLSTFRELNLLRPWPMRQKFDAIFCRNVMIYFDEPTKVRLLDRFADQLAPGGTLYIGHSERIPAPVSKRFECIGRTIFRRIGA